MEREPELWQRQRRSQVAQARAVVLGRPLARLMLCGDRVSHVLVAAGDAGCCSRESGADLRESGRCMIMSAVGT